MSESRVLRKMYAESEQGCGGPHPALSPFKCLKSLIRNLFVTAFLVYTHPIPPSVAAMLFLLPTFNESIHVVAQTAALSFSICIAVVALRWLFGSIALTTVVA